MARRKRLSLTPSPSPVPAPPGPDLSGRAPEVKSLRTGEGAVGPVAAPSPSPARPPSRPAAPPIAQVAGAASAEAALGDLAAEWQAARDGGRLVVALPLDAVDPGWLQRDRLGAGSEPGPDLPEDMADLAASLRDRGQQVPIEVVALPDAGQGGARYGLISGWRRLQALRHLHARTGEDRFATVNALLRRPESAAEAYRAMVEENEIRLGLSYYERARIAALAAQAGVHPDPRAAIAALFAAASRAKRSKIASFLTLHEALGDRLRFATAIPERLGLALARALGADPALAARLRERLRKSAPDTAGAELALLERALRPGAEAPPSPSPSPSPSPTPSPAPSPGLAPPSARRATVAQEPEEIVPGVVLHTEGGRARATLTLSGPKVDGALRDRLVAWLQGRG